MELNLKVPKDSQLLSPVYLFTYYLETNLNNKYTFLMCEQSQCLIFWLTVLETICFFGCPILNLKKKRKQWEMISGKWLSEKVRLLNTWASQPHAASPEVSTDLECASMSYRSLTDRRRLLMSIPLRYGVSAMYIYCMSRLITSVIHCNHMPLNNINGFVLCSVAS